MALKPHRFDYYTLFGSFLDVANDLFNQSCVERKNLQITNEHFVFRADSLTRIIYWPEPYQCTGKEPRLAHCDLRMNGQIYGHKYGCNWEGKSFVFLHCGKENLDQGKKILKESVSNRPKKYLTTFCYRVHLRFGRA